MLWFSFWLQNNCALIRQKLLPIWTPHCIEPFGIMLGVLKWHWFSTIWDTEGIRIIYLFTTREINGLLRLSELSSTTSSLNCDVALKFAKRPHSQLSGHFHFGGIDGRSTTNGILCGKFHLETLPNWSVNLIEKRGSVRPCSLCSHGGYV